MVEVTFLKFKVLFSHSGDIFGWRKKKKHTLPNFFHHLFFNKNIYNCFLRCFARNSEIFSFSKTNLLTFRARGNGQNLKLSQTILLEFEHLYGVVHDELVLFNELLRPLSAQVILKS